MTFKVQFEDNVPVTATEAQNGVVQKKYIVEGEKTIYDWILVEAESEEEALTKAKDLEHKINDNL